jgi:CubicO group peptidase (beta-lactamase class C family)
VERMKRIGILGAAVVAVALLARLTLFSQAPSIPSIANADVDRIFARWTPQTPGCSVGAAVNGRVSLSASYGMADLEHAVANTADTIFEAGSVAKQFTAAAVLLLARDGRLSLDDPIRKYIPEVPDYGAPITIRQLLTHTSGLRDWGSVAGIEGWPRGTRTHTHDHVLEIIGRQESVNFPPATHWSYSNSGYNLSAILVSRVSGSPFAEFTRVRIFEPLGMTRTSWRDNYRRVVKGRAIAYASNAGTFVMDMPFEDVHGNGGLLTTVGDLLKWNANFETPRVGDARFTAEQQQPGRFSSGRAHAYALGLRVSTYKGVREVAHGGATAGYRAYLARYPDHGVSVAVLCNSAEANPTEYAHAVAERLLGAAVKPSATAPPPIAEMQGPLTALERDPSYKPTPEQLAHFAGSYRSDEAAATFTVSVERDALVLTRRAATPRIVLTPRLVDTFEAGSDLGVVIFRRDRSGRVTELSVVQDRVWDLRFARQPRGTGSL